MIETRLLHYFLAVAKFRSITKAAENLHVSQPTLSKQLMELERQIGQPLLIRGKKSITLTEAGTFLQRRAIEILRLIEETDRTLNSKDSVLTGDIHVGCAEAPAASYVGQVFAEMQKQHPDIRLHLYSEDANRLMERLDSGMLDIALFTGPIPHEEYDHWMYPIEDSWGLLMPEDHPLAAQETVSLEDVYQVPLIFPLRIYASPWAPAEFVIKREALHVVATYNSIGGARHLVQQGVGCGFCLSKVLTQEMRMDGLAYRPLVPKISVKLSIITKKNLTLSPAAGEFLTKLRKTLENV